IFIGLFWLFSLFYALFFSKYIRNQLREEKNEFLQYTLNGIPARSRISFWIIVTLVGFIPLLLYACYSLSIGLYIAKNYGGLLTVLFVMGLVAITVVYTDNLRLTTSKENTDLSFTYAHQFNHSRLNLFNLFNHLNYNLPTFIVTKLVCLLTIYILINLFDLEESANNIRYLIFITMTIASINSALLYQDFIFEGKKLLFMLNFPYRKIQRFIFILPHYLLLILPEFIYLAVSLKFHLSIIAICSCMIFLLWIRSLILLVGNTPLSVIKSISAYYFVIFIFILYGFHFFALLCTLIASFLLFSRYYSYEKLQNNQD
ncbi:MAG: hypothetical protein ACRDE7_10065, partial [Sphingobacterium sp.]